MQKYYKFGYLKSQWLVFWFSSWIGVWLLPLNANFWVIGLIFKEGYIYSVVKKISMGRVTKKYAFDGFGV